MRIAYLIPNFPVLSETFVANEVGRLKALGFDLRIYSFSPPSLSDQLKLSDMSRALMKDTVYIDRRAMMTASIEMPGALLRTWTENRRMQAAATAKPSAIARLLRAVAVASQIKADGIGHLHAHWPYASQVAHLVHCILGVSYSISVHAHEVAHDNGHFPVVFRTLSFASFCNRGAMDYLLQRLVPDAHGKSHLVYHGVDVEHFPFADMPRNMSPINILSAGRLTKTKGFDRLICACAATRDTGVDIRLTILGRGAVEDDLRLLAGKLGFADCLTLPGWVTHDEVRQYIRDSHVFALLADTGFHDGLPNVVLEAMACGRPVILSPLPAATEAVTHHVEGYVLQGVDDIAGFVSAVQQLSSEPSLLRQMGLAARERVEVEHDADTQIKRLAVLFEEHLT